MDSLIDSIKNAWVAFGLVRDKIKEFTEINTNTFIKNLTNISPYFFEINDIKILRNQFLINETSKNKCISFIYYVVIHWNKYATISKNYEAFKAKRDADRIVSIHVFHVFVKLLNLQHRETKNEYEITKQGVNNIMNILKTKNIIDY